MTNDLFFDSDCLSAFLWVDGAYLLRELYGGRIILPDPVYRELSNPRIPHLKRRADILMNESAARIREIEAGTDEYKLYRMLAGGFKG